MSNQPFHRPAATARASKADAPIFRAVARERAQDFGVATWSASCPRPRTACVAQVGAWTRASALIANIGAALQHVRAAAEQFKSIDPWTLLLRYISDKIAPRLGPFRPADRLPATG
jgi:hypothetical protein